MADMEEIADDIQAMRASAEAISAEAGLEPEVLLEGDDPHVQAWREWSDVTDVLTGADDLEGSGALDQIEAAQGAWVPLGGGGMFVEQTRAMVTVDVNTGGDLSPAAASRRSTWPPCKTCPVSCACAAIQGRLQSISPL